MAVLSAQSIRARQDLIWPFHERTVYHGMSYGLDCAGYDIRSDRTVTLWPLSGVMVDSIEWFDIPTDLKPCVADKSTWARRLVTVQNTRIEPGWRGYLRVEITNHSWWFRRIYAGDPIATVEFHTLDYPTEQPYNGKYQNQTHNTSALFEDD